MASKAGATVGAESERGRQPNQPGQPQQELEEPPIWEEVMGAAGLVLLLFVVGFLVYEALQPKTPPAIIVAVGEITATPTGWLVEVRAENQGDEPAEGVVVEGALLDPAGKAVETAEISLDYVPERSQRQAGLFFSADPADYLVQLRAKGYVVP